jgi:aryl-alcohol dehydrogenase-like predicted oxidoreductase
MVEKTKQLVAFADDIGISLIHLALAWCLKNPNVSTVILGASNSDQLRDNLRAADVAEKVTPEVMDKIEQIVQSRPESWTEW